MMSTQRREALKERLVNNVISYEIRLARAIGRIDQAEVDGADPKEVAWSRSYTLPRLEAQLRFAEKTLAEWLDRHPDEA